MVLWTWHWNLIKTNCLFIDTRKKHNILLHIKTTTTCEKREAWVFRQPLVATELIWIFKKRFCVLFSYRPFLWLCSYAVGGVGIVEEYIVWKVFIHLFIIQRQVTTTSTFNIFILLILFHYKVICIKTFWKRTRFSLVLFRCVTNTRNHKNVILWVNTDIWLKLECRLF